MKQLTVLLVLVGLLLLAGVVSALAPPPGLTLDWWVMSGGGEITTSGPLQMKATVGQPAVGYSRSSPLALSWGYWQARSSGVPAANQVYLPVVLRDE